MVVQPRPGNLPPERRSTYRGAARLLGRERRVLVGLQPLGRWLRLARRNAGIAESRPALLNLLRGNVALAFVGQPGAGGECRVVLWHCGGAETITERGGILPP